MPLRDGCLQQEIHNASYAYHVQGETMLHIFLAQQKKHGHSSPRRVFRDQMSSKSPRDSPAYMTATRLRPRCIPFLGRDVCFFRLWLRLGAFCLLSWMIPSGSNGAPPFSTTVVMLSSVSATVGLFLARPHIIRFALE